jgi:enoyl-CoA hydratase/carnithine racemase
MSEVVLREIEDGVALLTLNRPDRLNAWTPELQTLYSDLLEDCAAREDVRAVVVTGAGRGFCAGADMEGLQSISSGDVDRSAAAGAGNGDGRQDTRPVAFALSIPKPVIAAINGACAGIGLTQALMCDVRFAADDAKLTTSFARRGLIAEYGISWILPRVVGWGVAMDLLLSGRVLLAEEAARLGLVNHVVAPQDLLPRAIAYAHDIAGNCAPSSLAVIKQQMYADTMRDVFEASDHAEKLMGESMQRPDFIEGITAFFEKRTPNFPPLEEVTP